MPPDRFPKEKKKTKKVLQKNDHVSVQQSLWVK